MLLLIVILILLFGGGGGYYGYSNYGAKGPRAGGTRRGCDLLAGRSRRPSTVR
jgi:hypothetical protein